MKLNKMLLAIAVLLAGYVGLSGTDGTGLAFSPSTLPDATVGVAYDQTLVISWDAAKSASSVRMTSSAPAGLRCVQNALKDNTATFKISGTPTAATTSPASLVFSVTFSDRTSSVGSIQLTVKDSGGSETTFSRESPSEESVTMAVGESKTFTVAASGSTAGIRYSWGVSSDADPTASVVQNDLSCTFTPTKAGTYYVIFTYGDSGQVYWVVTATGGGGSEGDKVTVSPTTLADATVGESYTATIAIGGVKSIQGGGCKTPTALPPGLTCRVTTSTMTAVVSGTPTKAGTYTFPLYIQVDASTSHTENITIKVNEAQASETTFSRESPTDQSVAMAVGESKTFTVSASGSTAGISYSWGVSSDADPTASVVQNDLSCTFTPTKAGTYYVIFTYGDSGQVYWVVTATGGGGSEGDKVTVSPTTLADATVGESYTATIAIGGVKSIQGGGCSSSTALPPGLTCRVTTSTMTAVVSGTPTKAGTYTFPLYIQVDASTSHTEDITIKVNEASTSETTFSRESPTDQSVAMAVGESKTFTVSASGSTAGISYSWGVSSDADPTASVVQNDLSCTFTPTKAGTYYVIFTYGDSGQVYWVVTATGGGGSEGDKVTVSPTTLADATVGESYTAAIAIGGVKSIQGGGCKTPTALPPGLTCRVTTSTMTAVVSGTPTKAGTYTFPLYIQVDASTSHTEDITIKVNEASTSETTFSRESPTDQSVAMAVGESKTFTVSASGSTAGISTDWGVSSTDDPTASVTKNGLSCTFTPTKAGTYYIIFTYGDSGQVYWVVTVTGEPADMGIPVLANSNEEFALRRSGRANIAMGEFSKQLKTRTGYEPIIVAVNVIGTAPAGVAVSDTGLVTGTMTDDLDGEQLTIEVITQSSPPVVNTYTETNVLRFVKRISANTPPYAAAATPADGTPVYLGSDNVPTFRVYACDEELNTLTYRWYFDGSMTAYQSDFFTPSQAQLGIEGQSHTVACYAYESDGSYQEVLLKSWDFTVAKPDFAITSETFADGEVGASMSSYITYRMPVNDQYQAVYYVTSLDVIEGELPPGIATFYSASKASGDAYIGGTFRKAGTYAFRLRARCSNGATDEKSYVITVSGADSSPITWTIGTGGGSGGKTTNGGGTTARNATSIKQALMMGAAAGDTMNIQTLNLANEDVSTFKYLEGITVNLLKSDPLVFPVGPAIPDATAFGTNVAFSVNIGQYPYDDNTYGAKMRIARVDTRKGAAEYRIYGLDKRYRSSEPAIDEDGWLYVNVGCVPYDAYNDRLYLADVLGRRDVIFEDITFSLGVAVRSEGVLPGSITFRGVNTVATGRTIEMPVKATVEGDSTLILMGALGDDKFEGVEFEAGATIRIDPNGDDFRWYGYRMFLPQAGAGKVRLELTGAMTVASPQLISPRYVGDDDPMTMFEIVPASGDTQQYRLVRGVENALMLEVYEEPDPGEISWTDDENLPGVTQGGSFSFSFTATGPKTQQRDPTDRSGTKMIEVDAYHDFTYSFVDAGYSFARGTTNTFDESVGEQELLQGPWRVGADANSTTTEIGFPFPAGSSFVSTVTVSPAALSVGDASIVLFDKGFLFEVHETFSHIYVARSPDSFTVRYGRFASITLTPDGLIRVAYGPDADTLSVEDPQIALCHLTFGGKRVDFSSTEPYADSCDVIFTPSCPPGLTLSGNTLSGRPLLPGAYSLAVKVEATDDARNTYEMTRTFSLAVVPGRLREDAPVITITKSPELGEDGYVHLLLGTNGEFAASVDGDNQIRWTLDGDVVSSSGAYTLAAPATRSLDEENARIHCLAVEADDQNGRYNWAVRKVWRVVYNRKVFVDAAKATSAGGGAGAAGGGGDTTTTGTSTGTGTGTGTGGGTGGGGATADGSTPGLAFGDFQEGMFRFLLNGDEIVVAPGTYHTPVDFGDYDAAVTIRSTGSAADTILDLTDNDKGYTRCFRQAMYVLDYGKSGSMERFLMPVCAARMIGFAICGGAIDSEIYPSDYPFDKSTAQYHGVSGGGTFGGIFENCLIERCAALDYGGGAYGAALLHCVVRDCEADVGGGLARCDLDYCTVVENTAISEAGGIEGQCSASRSIVRYNVAAGKENEYAATITPVRLVPTLPELDDCFCEGDPRFCAEYHLAFGSPAAGKGAFPDAEAGSDCIVTVDTIGGGTVSPNPQGGIRVTNGDSVEFNVSGRSVKSIFVDGVKVENPTIPYTLANIVANITITFVFEPAALTVGSGGTYPTIADALLDARSGDTIKVGKGTYAPVNVRNFEGELTIEGTDESDPPIIDAQGSGRCIVARRGSEDIVFRNLLLVNGCAQYTSSKQTTSPQRMALLPDEYSEDDLLALGLGGGVFGGVFEHCIISNCTALGNMGGGAFGARLVNCEIVNNSAGSKTDNRVCSTYGGGALGGYVEKCRVTGNRLVTSWTQAYAECAGAGVCDAELRDSFVWDNFADYGTSHSAVASDADKGENGVVVHTTQKAPTEARLAEHKDPVPIEGTEEVYASQEEAAQAAAKQVADIATEVARVISDQDAYVSLFEIVTIAEAGGYFNKPEFTEAAAARIKAQIEGVLTKDDNGNERTEFQVQKMEKTLVETTPGLYYALEFSSDLSSGSFKGERHLATGSGSVKLSATSLDTPSGFWRVKVYKTPKGE